MNGHFHRGTAMSGFALAIAGLLCAAIWLVLLVVTAFSLLVVAMGLLAALSILSPSTDHTSSAAHRHNSVRR